MRLSTEICQTLLRNQSTLTVSDIDINCYVEEAFQQVLTKHDQRQDAFRVLTMLYEPLSSLASMTSLTTQQQHSLKRINPLLDRLSTWIESIQVYEIRNGLSFIQVLVDMKFSEITTYWNTRVINKLIPLLFRLIQKMKINLNDINVKRHYIMKALAAEDTSSYSSYQNKKRQRYQDGYQPFTSGKQDHQQLLSMLHEVCLERDNMLAFLTFYFEIFQLFLMSNHLRSNLLPHTKMIRDVISGLLPIDIPITPSSESGGDRFVSVVTNVMATATSLEATDIWAIVVQTVVLEMIQCLQKLSLPLSTSLVYSHLSTLSSVASIATGNGSTLKIQVIDWSLFENFCGDEKSSDNEVHGIAKALWLKSIFSRLSVLLGKIFAYGCSSGFVSFDLTPFFALSSGLLPLGVDANSSDPANFIENQQRLSVIDLAFVLTELKVSFLHSLKALVQLNLTGMIRYGGLLVQPVMSLLARKESLAVPSLLYACFEYIRTAIGALPSTVALVVNNGSNILIDLFGLHMQLVSVNRSKMAAVSAVLQNNTSASSLSIPISGSSLVAQGKMKVYDEDDIEFENDRLSVAIFQTIEHLLIHCGALLNQSIRQTIEQLINIGLNCLDLGVLSITCPDRRLKRLRMVERLRYSTSLQSSLIAVGLAEVIAASKTGMLSSNVTPLRSVCQSLVKSVHSTVSGTHLTYEVKRILLVLGQILYPSAIPLPITAPADLTSQYLVRLSQVEDVENTKANGVKKTVQSSVDAEENDNKKVTIRPTMDKDVSKSIPVQKQQEEKTIVPPTEGVPPTLKFPSAFQNPKAKSSTNESDSEDDDIPDLNLEDDENE